MNRNLSPEEFGQVQREEEVLRNAYHREIDVDEESASNERLKALIEKRYGENS